MELLKKSFKLYDLLIVAAFMCFMLVISFNMIGTAFLTREIGYTAYGTKSDDEEPTKLYEYYFEDGEEKKEKTINILMYCNFIYCCDCNYAF